jgi:16S rRNA processing protein RimM
VTSLHTAIARVVRTHGTTGELSVGPVSDDPSRLPEGTLVWFAPPPLGVRRGRVEGVRRGPKGPLLKVSGVDDLTTASPLSGTTILVDPHDLPADWTPPPGDLTGLVVRDESGAVIGELRDVIETGANDVWVLVREEGSELLLPVIDEVLVDLDLERRRATVRLLPGLGE